MTLRIATYNIHKGVMGLRRPALTIHELRRCLHDLDADLVFLQEVQGRHDGHARRFPHWPTQGQHEFLAGHSALDDVLGHASAPRYFSAYGMNAVYPEGHHGNALLSRFPIEWAMNQDVSDHRLEQRGLLHARVITPQGPVHALVVHFGLFGGSRARQAEQLVSHVQRHTDPHLPLIVAGDFNDWRRKLGPVLRAGLKAHEVIPDQHARRWVRVGSFPARWPVLGLDRVFVRGFEAVKAVVPHGPQWSALSDHSPFVVDLEPKGPA
ncbi:MAG: endonuclease/exonuclease/phosphatase family protein [Limnobacter sp.]|uniref:endonuclease/exonuclease/phosphatase family protein n=1 Tax=Limnobacter sp. TaxID=2003368 RepID=UPI00391AB83B